MRAGPYIDGRESDATGGITLPVHNPTDGEQIGFVSKPRALLSAESELKIADTSLRQPFLPTCR